jgi:nucleoid DNA-binding protein
MATAPKTLSKSEIIAAIAENTGLARKQVNSVFAALSEQVGSAVGKKGPGVFALPGLVKI